MSSPKCPHCGSTQTNVSPSGRHLVCAKCHRVSMQARPHARSRGRLAKKHHRAEPENAGAK